MARTRRSLPPGDEPWITFSVDVTIVRGSDRVRASIVRSGVTGVADSPYRPEIVWTGTVGLRAAGEPVTPELAASWARTALDRVFPVLF